MPGRAGGKKKPLKKPKSKDGPAELDDDDVAAKERQRAEQAALKAMKEKAQQHGPLSVQLGIKKSH